VKNSSQNYNIYRSSRRRNAAKRRNFALACLIICMGCVIADIVFISMLISKKNNKPAATSTTTAGQSSYETDEEGNPIVPTDLSGSDTTADPAATSSETAPVAKVTTVDADTRAANLAALQKKVGDYLTQQSGRYSMCYINLNNGETIGVNETTPFIAASSIKLAYNTYLYEKAEAGEISLDEKIAYKASKYVDGVNGGDYEGGTGTIQNSADGTEYQLSEASHLSITISDNCGTNMVIRRLGGEDAINNNFFKTISSVVDYRTKATYTDYTGTEKSGMRRTSAVDLAKYADHLYKDYKRNPSHYEPLINDLCHTEYSWGVPAGVPSEIDVGHKVGFNGPAYNDIGIVFGTEDYVLCLMTESGDASRAKTIMGEVSKMVYEYVESNYA